LLPKKIISAAHFCCQKSNFAAQKNTNAAAQKNNFAAQSNKFAAHFTNSLRKIPKVDFSENFHSEKISYKLTIPKNPKKLPYIFFYFLLSENRCWWENFSHYQK
jgi:hypothetical protein